jgi:4-hydroxythreonine-4-phosphate dehydrogenase
MSAAGPLRLAVTAGDPAGIGPEINARSLADGRLPAAGSRLRPPGSRRLRARALAPLLVLVTRRVRPRADRRAGARPDSRWTPSAHGQVAAASVRAAANAALAGKVHAVVTAPLAKVALHAAGVRFPGHTEMLQDLAGSPTVAMMFVAGTLRLTLATIHIPLADVARRLDVAGLVEKIRLTRDAVCRADP